MAEWTIAMVLKTIGGVSFPGVRIPLPPLVILSAERSFLTRGTLFGPCQLAVSESGTEWGGARVDDWGRLLSG
jgi:hypothetical protein